MTAAAVDEAPAPVMSIDAPGVPVAVVHGFGFTAEEIRAAAPPRLRPTIGTAPYGSWACLDELVLATDPATGRTEVAQIVGMRADHGSATVHWPDRRWSACPIANVIAPLPEAHR